jgi:hypothetical protein
MNKTEIKKALYKQKPDAELVGFGKMNEAYVKGFSDTRDFDTKEGKAYYEAYVDLTNDTIRIFFEIPEEEMFNEEGQEVLNKVEPAQLLIRWLI